MINKTLDKQFQLGLVFFLFLGLLQSFGQYQNVKGKKLIIYTKNGEGYVHENIATSVATLEKICQSLGVETTITDNPEIFLNPNIMDFDAVIFANTNNEAFDNAEQRDAFQNFCSSGKGFGGLHSAIGSERKWPWFWKLIGGSFLRHPPFQTFSIKVNRKNHSSTKHLLPTFDLDDECYFIKNVNPSFKILLEADLSTVSENDSNAYRPKRAPLSWYNTLEGGRQWYTALGHSKDLYALPWFQKHLQGGIEFILKD
ncbi:ThuA domain-containing protein [Flavobacteriaceae bacterium]|nr:ThuA domain-containing protein [Flavobacteriaceae bacterium]